MSLLSSQNHTTFSVWIVDPTRERIATACVVPRAPTIREVPPQCWIVERTATGDVIARAPAIPGVPPECQPSCSGIEDHLTKLFGGRDAAVDAALTTCSDNVFQSFKSCVECGYNTLPTTFPLEEVRELLDVLNQFGAECNKRGLPVQHITFNTTTTTSKTSAALFEA